MKTKSPDEGDVLRELRRIVNSEAFLGDKALRGLLPLLVFETLADRRRPSECRRAPAHVDDPAAAALMSRNVERLRLALAHYYRTEGRHSVLRITLPAQTGRPGFRLLARRRPVELRRRGARPAH